MSTNTFTEQRLAIALTKLAVSAAQAATVWFAHVICYKGWSDNQFQPSSYHIHLCQPVNNFTGVAEGPAAITLVTCKPEANLKLHLQHAGMADGHKARVTNLLD